METDQERLAERLAHLAAIADDVRHADRDLLTRMDREELTRQYEARWALLQHLRYIWDSAKADGLDPATDPAWMSLGMLCDLITDLFHTASTAQPAWATSAPGTSVPRVPAQPSQTART